MSNKHQYALVFLTALLSGVASTAGVYIMAPYQTEQVIKQKNHENRTVAYNKFLDTLTSEKYPNLFHVVAIGKMSVNVTGDASIQAIEDTIFELSKEPYKFLYSVTKQCQNLALYGSDRVQRYCDDMISVVLDNEYFVDWDFHTPEVINTRNSWVNNDGQKLGWEPKVSDEERANFFILSAQYVELIEQLKSELKSNT
ncbi:hypothetical protein [Vibrio splendidus]|uniref:hypothetical protein n=1 Tax=Vibrio splendidus TaxID=29497 RepID=UPI0002DE19B0|nr:hypothetical protein [Vibrio splendidus]MDP2590036.1 hypothetical protein [Vibrio splendidus]OEE53548.1 hypothetical protein A146_10395 [Vibrio splendidus FF-500]